MILELSDPQVEQEALNARLALQSAEAALENLRVQLQTDLLTQQAQVASIEAEYKQAVMDAEANDALAKQKLVSALSSGSPSSGPTRYARATTDRSSQLPRDAASFTPAHDHAHHPRGEERQAGRFRD